LIANFPTSDAVLNQNRKILLLPTAFLTKKDGLSKTQKQKVNAFVQKATFFAGRRPFLVGFLASKSRVGTCSLKTLPAYLQ